VEKTVRKPAACSARVSDGRSNVCKWNGLSVLNIDFPVSRKSASSGSL